MALLARRQRKDRTDSALNSSASAATHAAALDAPDGLFAEDAVDREDEEMEENALLADLANAEVAATNPTPPAAIEMPGTMTYATYDSQAPPPPTRITFTKTATDAEREAARVAQDAVERVLADQAESRMFDVVDKNRVVITLQLDDLEAYRAAWVLQNSVVGRPRTTFSQYLSNRLRVCRTHTAARPIYIDDSTRLQLEELFVENVHSAQDLLNMVDRYIRPVLDCKDSDGKPMRMPPIDPRIMELVTNWFPEKSAAAAYGDYMLEATQEKLGLL